MLTLISTALSFLMGGLPKLLDFFQDKGDKKHELALAAMQMERELKLMEAGYAAQARVEEIRTDQIDLSESTTFGYNLTPNKPDLFNDLYDDENDEFEDYYEIIDEDEIISFLNEYYLIYPTKLPKSELF